MTDFLETTVDKFTFKVAADRLYSAEGIWVKAEDGRVRIGVSDFLQQRSGDVAFADIKPAGAVIAKDDEIATIETIKVNISLTCPVTGTIIEVNSEMDASPEIINQDPFGRGWLAVIETTNWDVDKAQLLDAQSYFVKMKREAELEVKK
jgi:glycine cleavage system H protein